MREREWLEHGPASINLLLADLSERDKLQKMCAAIIASVWVKDATLSTFWPEFKEEEDKAKRAAKFETQKAIINNAQRRKLDGKRSK
jgi:hypothetical protein